MKHLLDDMPRKSPYFVGGKVISFFRKTNKPIEPTSLYVELLAGGEIEPSYPYFVLGLDWLFLIGIVKIQKGKVTPCF